MPATLAVQLFLNYNGSIAIVVRGFSFVFDREQKTFHYDGCELARDNRRYPRSSEANELESDSTQ